MALIIYVVKMRVDLLTVVFIFFHTHENKYGSITLVLEQGYWLFTK